MSISAISTPVTAQGVPTLEEALRCEIEEIFAVWKKYHCSNNHTFTLTFASPYNLPVIWECPECTGIAVEQ